MAGHTTEGPFRVIRGARREVRRKRRIAILSAVMAITVALPLAQSNPRYIPFSPSDVKGVLYKPDAGPAPHVGILIMHRTSNFLAHLGSAELSKRGFAVLTMNSRFDNNEASVNWEDIALDVRSGVEFLRNLPGITQVVLFGHSGGGATMSFYQAVAENGPGYCQGPGKLAECGDELAGLPPADGIIFVDAHPGISVNALRSLSPAVANDNDPRQIKAELDPFNPDNGFNPSGLSTYPKEFKDRYFKAQAQRMNRLIDSALKKSRQMKEGKGPYPDDDVFLIVRGQGARLMDMDTSINHNTVKPQKLLKNDGTVVHEIVRSVRRVSPQSPDRNAGFARGVNLLTVRSFLSANAIRATDSMNDVDDCSTNNSTRCALPQISVPLLVTAMGGHYFIRDNEIHYEVAASTDKDYVIIEGATHGVRPCTSCETVPGQYSNSVKNFFDYLQTWINARF